MAKRKTDGFDTIIDLIKSFKPLKRWIKPEPDSLYTEITFSFPNWSELRENDNKTLTTLNKYQQEFAKKILQQWSDISNIKFIEVGSEYDSNIKFGLFNNINEINYINSHKIAGVATFPVNNSVHNKKIEKIDDYSPGGQVWINLSKTVVITTLEKVNMTETQKNKVGLFKQKSDGIRYYFEEDTEVITLYKNINAKAHIENTVRSPEWGDYTATVYLHETGHALGLPHTFIVDENTPNIAENSQQYSVMSYRYPNLDNANYQYHYPMTPQLIDIYVIQKFYGQNMTTRTEDTIYGFNSNSQREFYSLSSPNDIIIGCIWDAGGIDTLDFSKFNIPQKIDLNEGAFSDIGGLRNNVSIAYDTLIENAIGGSHNDVIFGNEMNNTLYGNEGNDIIYGDNGDDLIYGGSGGDKLYGDEGNDSLYGAEGADMLYGGAGHNQLIGGQGKDIFIIEINKKSHCYNTIYDYEKDEDYVFFTDGSNRITSFNSLISNNEIKFSIKNNKKNNITKVSITSDANSIEPNIIIDFIGQFSIDELFN